MGTFQSLEQPADASELDAPTTPIEASGCEPVRESFPLLHHRVQRRAIPRGLAPSGHYLAFEEGNETLLIRLESTITHVGRGGTCDVRFEDQRVSRDHAIVVRQGRHVRVLDNRSVHGTFVNGRQIIAANIASGDVIRVGPLAMQYVEVS